MDSRGQEGAELNYYDWESDCGDCEGSLIVTRGGALLNILGVEGGAGAGGAGWCGSRVS